MHFRAVQWIFLLEGRPAAEPSAPKVPQLHRGGCGSATTVRIPAGGSSFRAEVKPHTWEQCRVTCQVGLAAVRHSQRCSRHLLTFFTHQTRMCSLLWVIRIHSYTLI